MPFSLSPGVTVVEKDFSTIVPTVSTSAGAFCGPFAWGPIEDPVRVSSETDLAARFGIPTDSNFQSFFTGANFLAYANNLLVTRTDAPNLKNAVSVKSGSVEQANLVLTNAGTGYFENTDSGVTVTFSAPEIEGGVTATGTVEYTVAVGGAMAITGVTIVNGGTGYLNAPTVTISAPAAGPAGAATASVLRVDLEGVKIKNASSYLSAFVDSQGVNGMFAAKFAGSKGNNLGILVVDAGSWASLTSTQKTLFTGKPGQSQFAKNNGVDNDELHVVIYDTPLGEFSGVPGAILEKYTFLSKLSDAKRSDGSNNYYKNVINSQSRYVWWLDHPSAAQLSEPENVNVVDNVSGVAATFAPAGTISIALSGNTDPVYLILNEYKQFFDAATDKATRQIAVTGTVSNNGMYNVSSVVFTPEVGTVTGAVITTTTAFITEYATETKIESVSKAAWGVSALAASTIAGAKTLKVLSSALSIALSGGTDDFGSSEGDVLNAYAMLTNADQYDISLIMTGNMSATTAASVVTMLAEVRKDCIAFLSPNVGGQPITVTGSDATDLIVEYRDATNISSSYAVMDSGFKYQYDRYNDKYRWIPLNGDIAGLCARTDYTADPWYSPGGFNRGQIKNVVKLAFAPNQSDRDVLYAAGVNPVVSFPGQGTVLYGDKTMLAKPSAFDRINVRRLFIVLEKAVAVAAKYQLFEFNDDFTRAQFKNLVEPFLRDVQGRRGITDFRLKCDASNNTGEVIDRNEFVADIFIKPARSINYITLNFVAARTSVSFEEIGG